MRRLRLLVSVLVLVDTMLFTALTPLLPHFVHRYELSKTGAGLLVAADAAGVLALGIPAGAAAVRFGPRRVVLGGLALVGVASLGFAFAQDGWTLGLARFAQGAGSAFTWAGSLAWLVAATPRARRGAMIGEALGAAIFGALLGPAIGATAGALGVRAVFAALAGLAGLLAAAVLRVPAGPAGERVSFVRTAFSDRPLLAAMWLTLLPAFLFGILSVLVPLRLGRAGWGATAIGAVFLSSAAFEAVVSPLVGRISDRRGRLAPLRLALLAAAAVSVALAWASAEPLVV